MWVLIAVREGVGADLLVCRCTCLLVHVLVLV